LGNDGYRNYFINRFADLMNSLLSPSSVISYIDELQNMIVSEMRREMDRWGPEGPWGRQNFSDWEQNIEDVRDFARQRPWHMREQIMEKFELEDTAKVVVLPPVGDGTVRINSITPDELPWEGLYYQGVPITISAVPEPGYLFYQWSDTTLAPQPEITVNLEGDRTFQAVFYFGYLIEDIQVESITDSSADISWSTNVPTCGQITYGLSESMGYVTEKDKEVKEVHCIPLRDLEPDTVYYFQIACEDSSGLQNQCAVMTFRTLEEATATQVLVKGIPEAFGLSPNYPNPFNSATCWEIALPEPGLLQAVIYNVSGQAVHRLFHRKLPEGIMRLVWDGHDDSGQAFVSGVYIMRVVFEGESGKRERAVARLVMIR
ncbi:CotH kinase family protein, partial [bacterium]